MREGGWDDNADWGVEVWPEPVVGDREQNDEDEQADNVSFKVF